MKSKELDSAIITLNPIGFVHIFFKKTKGQIGVDEAKLFFTISMEITRGKKMPALINFSQGFPKFSNGALSYFANNKLTHLRQAEAYVVSDVSKRMLVRFYHLFHKPKNPLRVFEKEQEAIIWLKEFIIP